MIIEVNEHGELVLPAAVVQAAPHTRVEVERLGDAVVLRAVEEAAAERRSILDGWPTFDGIPGDPNATFRREDIYDEDGR